MVREVCIITQVPCLCYPLAHSGEGHMLSRVVQPRVIKTILQFRETKHKEGHRVFNGSIYNPVAKSDNPTPTPSPLYSSPLEKFPSLKYILSRFCYSVTN